MIEIVAIGDEILSGSTINTNATFLSKQLTEEGYTIHRHLVLSDSEEEMKRGLLAAIDRNNIVIVTGGLGPTIDDRTRSVICQVMETHLKKDVSVRDKLIRRFQRKDPVFETLSQVPEKARILHNLVGLAPGFIFSDDKIVIFLPGVPEEMRQMFLTDVLPFLQNRFLVKKREAAVLCFALLAETEIEEALLKIKEKDSQLNYGIYPSVSGICVELTHDVDPKKIRDYIHHLEKNFEKSIYAKTKMDIAHALHEACLEKKKKIAFAESCTGGALAATVTAISHSSQYFLGSIVSYSNEMKKHVLGVREETLISHGAVSEPTVEEMAKGLFRITKADYVVAISGIAGPTGATPTKPIGTICMAIGERGQKIDVGTIYAPGDRQNVVHYSVNFALSVLWRRVCHQLPYFSSESIHPFFKR